MSHDSVLRLLSPIELTGVHAEDQTLEAAQLDLAQAQAAGMIAEMFPNTAENLLTDWERVYGVPAQVGDTIQIRRDRVLQKMRELGRLDRPYFTLLAEGLGFTIFIDELHPFMAGWGYAGEELGDDESDWCWDVYVLDGPAGYLATLESLFVSLKPADTFVSIISLLP